MIGRYALSKSSLQYFVRHTTTCVNNFLIYNVSAFFYSIHDSENYSFLWSLPKESQSCLIMIYIILKHFYHVGLVGFFAMNMEHVTMVWYFPSCGVFQLWCVVKKVRMCFIVENDRSQVALAEGITKTYLDETEKFLGMVFSRFT